MKFFHRCSKSNFLQNIHVTPFLNPFTSKISKRKLKPFEFSFSHIKKSLENVKILPIHLIAFHSSFCFSFHSPPQQKNLYDVEKKDIFVFITIKITAQHKQERKSNWRRTYRSHAVYFSFQSTHTWVKLRYYIYLAKDFRTKASLKEQKRINPQIKYCCVMWDEKWKWVFSWCQIEMGI